MISAPGNASRSAIERRNHRWRHDVARSAVAEIRRRGEPAQHGEAMQPVRRERQQRRADRGRSSAARSTSPRPRRRARGGLGGAHRGRRAPGCDRMSSKRSSVATRCTTSASMSASASSPSAIARGEVLHALLAERHLESEAGADRPHGVAQSEDPVGDHEPLEAPLVAQDLRQQRAVLAAPVAVDGVIGGHHAGDALLRRRGLKCGR